MSSKSSLIPRLPYPTCVLADRQPTNTSKRIGIISCADKFSQLCLESLYCTSEEDSTVLVNTQTCLLRSPKHTLFSIVLYKKVIIIMISLTHPLQCIHLWWPSSQLWGESIEHITHAHTDTHTHTHTHSHHSP